MGQNLVAKYFVRVNRKNRWEMESSWRESTKRLSNLSKEEIQNLIEQEDAESTQKGTQECYCNSFGSLSL